MTPASALRKDANRASRLVSPSQDMLAPPSGQRGTPYAPVTALNTRPCDSVRLERCSETAAAEAPETRAVHRRTAVSRRLFPLFPDAAFRPRPAAVPPGQAPRPGTETRPCRRFGPSRLVTDRHAQPLFGGESGFRHDAMPRTRTGALITACGHPWRRRRVIARGL